MNLFENLQIMKESCIDVKQNENIKNEAYTSHDVLWNNFNRHYEGFIPIRDLSNYLGLYEFGEFVKYCLDEADEDYDHDKVYYSFDDCFNDLNRAFGKDGYNNEVDDISVENVFNYFSTDDLKEFWDWVKIEYDLEEATSSIGGAYTTKAIDMFPTKNIKKVNENIYDEYLERVMDETSNVALVNLLHEIRDNTKLKTNDKKKLEDKIKTKVKTIKTEAVIEFYGKEWTDEEIQKMIKTAKENPGIEMVADPNKVAHPMNYNGKNYWLIGEEKEIVYDGKDCVVILTVDDDLNRYLSYFEYVLVDDGDAESGPQELTPEVSDVPYKVVAL